MYDLVDKQENLADSEDTKNPAQGKKIANVLTPNQDNIDNRLHRNFATTETEGNGVWSLLQNVIDACIHDAEEIIDLNNFWDYAEK